MVRAPRLHRGGPGFESLRAHHRMLNTSDQALAELLDRLKFSANPDEVRQLSSELEQLIFHKQMPSAETEE